MSEGKFTVLDIVCAVCKGIHPFSCPREHELEIVAKDKEIAELREALEAIENFPITDPENLDAYNMRYMARKALSRGKEKANGDLS